MISDGVTDEEPQYTRPIISDSTEGPSLKRSLSYGQLEPPSILNSPWVENFKAMSTGMASGWMAFRGGRRNRLTDRGFVLSDHADWVGLNEAVKATEAENIYVTHGYSSIFSKWLSEQGLNARAIETAFEGELTEISEKDRETEN